MRSFMRSGVHRRIMARRPEWCDEAAVVRWVQDADDPPSWAEAHRRYATRGPAFEGQSPVGGPRRFDIRKPTIEVGVSRTLGTRGPRTRQRFADRSLFQWVDLPPAYRLAAFGALLSCPGESSV